MADRISPEKRSWNMSRIRGKNTTPEIKFRSLLHREGFRFRLHSTKLPGHPDVILPRYRTAVFVHGCYWHRHEGCPYATTPKTRTEFWLEKFEKNTIRDKEVKKLLEENHWNVFIAWECEIRQNPDDVILRFQNFVETTAHGQ